MEVRFKDKRQQGLCVVTILLTFTDTEKAKMDKFGYPEVDIGGHFTDGQISFDLESEIKKVSQFPISQRFDGVELGHELAKKKADIYSATMGIKLKNLWLEFKAISDDFGGEVVFTV